MAACLTAARYRLLLLFILGAAAVGRFLDLRADPPLDGARDLSLSTDGAWYAGAALERARGRSGGEGGPYDRPIFTALVSAATRVVGPSGLAAALVSAVAGLLTIALTASLARRLHGPEAGLLAGGLLAADYGFLIYSRAPNVYGPAALVAAGVLHALAPAEASGRPGWKRLALAWGLVLAGGLWLKSILFLLAPALLWAAPVPAKGRRLLLKPAVLAAALALSALAIAAGLRTGWLAENYHKLSEYLSTGPGESGAGSGGLFWRALTLELRSGVASASPAILALLFIHLLQGGRAGSAAERFAGRSLVVLTGLLALLQYSPLRYFIPLYPCLGLLGAGALRGLLAPAGEAALTPPAVEAVPSRRRTQRALLGAYLVLQCLLALSGEPTVAGLGGLVLVSLLVALGLVWAPPLAGTLRWAALGLGAAAILAGAARGGVALAEPRYSLRHAAEEAESVLPPASYLTGPFAHVLTSEGPLRRKYIPRLLYGGGRLGRNLRAEGFTHLATDIPRDPAPFFAAFQADGAELEPVWELTVRGAKVGLYRFPWADESCERSTFERAMKALRAGRRAEAEAALRLALGERARFAAAAAVLGTVLLEDGREAEGVGLLEQALRWNPDELPAARALAALHLKRRDHAAARELFQKIAEADPEDLEAARLVEALAGAR
jgi:4-amino-4-deoxy-L-arabinose transferase-like glycosyltransferase